MDRAIKYNDKMGKRYEECVCTRARSGGRCLLRLFGLDLLCCRVLTPPCVSLSLNNNRSPFGGVDLWFVLGLAAFLVPFGGLAVGLATGAIHTPANF